MRQQVDPATKLKGSADLPPDKSISHRAAMFASIHDGISRISNYSDAADPQSTLHCLRELGVNISQEGSEVIVEGVGRNGYRIPKVDLDCGNSGTTMRLLSGILAGAGIPARMVGDASLSARPMKRITEPLSQMGAKIQTSEKGTAPLNFFQTKLKAFRYELPVPSAQVKSAVLLAGLFADDETEVIESTPSRDHTERMLDLKVEIFDSRTIIRSSRETEIPNMSGRIPGDFSAATFWMVGAAILPGSEISIQNVGVNPTRTGALEILSDMGLSIERTQRDGLFKEPVSDIKVYPKDHLLPVNISGSLIANCIDELPILSVAMAFADGTSRVSGAGELRVKETDRIHAVVQMLKKANVVVREYPDGFEVKGNPDHSFQSAEFESFHDHRIAMSSAILALRSRKGSTILGAESASISYPNFWENLQSLAT
jgi:3-phosphoshikimate 1-carboxyvinyltransferase